jgi:hypothetical protein
MKGLEEGGEERGHMGRCEIFLVVEAENLVTMKCLILLKN